MFDAAIRELRIALAELAYDDDREQVRAALRVLEAAALVLPLINIPEDGEWYQITAKVKRTKDGTRFDNPLVAALPDAPKDGGK